MIHPSLEYPPEPEEVSGDIGADAGHLRYDDVIQDGRLRLESAWRPTGLWNLPDVARVLRNAEPGVTTVLSRTVLEAADVALAPRAPLRTRVRYRFEHAVSASGEVERLLFLTWLEAFARGKDGVEHFAARAYGQRVFTRLGAKSGEHLVRRLSGFGESGVPPHRGKWESASLLLELPRGAEPLDARPRLCPSRVVFGLSHTDLNQHVNFLMYQRAVESAALARFVDHGLGAKFVSRHVAFGYRKPSFAGDVVRVALAAFRLEGLLGVAAAVVDDDGGPAERASFREFGSPRCMARMVFRP